jgi:hypothetical protein
MLLHTKRPIFHFPRRSRLRILEPTREEKAHICLTPPPSLRSTQSYKDRREVTIPVSLAAADGRADSLPIPVPFAAVAGRKLGLCLVARVGRGQVAIPVSLASADARTDGQVARPCPIRRPEPSPAGLGSFTSLSLSLSLSLSISY